MTDSQIGRLFHDGCLDEAIAEAGRAAQRTPTDVGTRILLAELLLFAGDFERADAILLAADAVDPGAALVVAEFRQLLRAASARRQLGAEGRLPNFLGAPTAAQTHALEAFVALRAGDQRSAALAVEAAEAVRSPSAGISNGEQFADFRDADDLCGGSLEVLTTTGKYYWIPIERVCTADFHSPKRPRDLFWRRCTMSVREGPDGDVYVPALYETGNQADDTLRLGRSTDWSEETPVRGFGQRTFLVGEGAIPINQIQNLAFA